mmetsp:Transcript_28150/g.45265  ORF Transcript_28150/g.45265 Transcript_28150/m.45265 type:complete len:101 (-) Transcript_28150:118-420(-)
MISADFPQEGDRTWPLPARSLPAQPKMQRMDLMPCKNGKNKMHELYCMWLSLPRDDAADTAGVYPSAPPRSSAYKTALLKDLETSSKCLQTFESRLRSSP